MRIASSTKGSAAASCGMVALLGRLRNGRFCSMVLKVSRSDCADAVLNCGLRHMSAAAREWVEDIDGLAADRLELVKPVSEVSSSNALSKAALWISRKPSYPSSPCVLAGTNVSIVNEVGCLTISGDESSPGILMTKSALKFFIVSVHKSRTQMIDAPVAASPVF